MSSSQLPVKSAHEVYGNAVSIVTSLEVPESSIQLGNKIGAGAFGEVFAGTWQQSDARKGSIPVAVKRIKSDKLIDAAVVDSIYQEVKTMAQLSHDNICRILAYCKGPSPLIVLEFVEGGSLSEHLRAFTTPPKQAFMYQIIYDAASGLSYLTDHGVRYPP